MKAGIAEAGYSGVAMQHMGALVHAMNGMLAAWPPTRDEGITRIRVNLASVGYHWPWLRLQLARALDARGDSAEAADQYRRFATRGALQILSCGILARRLQRELKYFSLGSRQRATLAEGPGGRAVHVDLTATLREE